MDGVNHYTVPNSLTPDIVNITRTSNVNQPGLWVFKVDDYNIIAGILTVDAAIAVWSHCLQCSWR